MRRRGSWVGISCKLVSSSSVKPPSAFITPEMRCHQVMRPNEGGGQRKKGESERGSTDPHPSRVVRFCCFLHHKERPRRCFLHQRFPPYGRIAACRCIAVRVLGGRQQRFDPLVSTGGRNVATPLRRGRKRYAAPRVGRRVRGTLVRRFDY